ncbi:MAG: glycosyltransferase family 2 protein [Micrococcaceae bacterium]
MLFGQRVDVVLLIALLLIFSAVVYGVTLLILSRFERRGRPADEYVEAARAYADGVHVVFVLPCLNEDRVIGNSLDRLSAMDSDRMTFLVIDDGSDDDTAAIVEAHPDERVKLLRRVAPNARQGKGEALNAAIPLIRRGLIAPGMDPENVIVCVIDADGRLDPEAMEKVLPLFVDSQLGAVQVGVRINNRSSNLLARMQDIEFVLYTKVFQRGRRHLNSVGLGGNGQFVRLAALNMLGEKPWSRSLAEDLDLGVQLMVNGWNTEFESSVAVHQQGLEDIKRWVKQRTRWFQGHLQSWTMIPWVMRNLSGTRRVDLTYHLSSPILLLIGSLLSIAFALWTVYLVVAAVTLTLQFSPWWITAYLIAFGVPLLYGVVYWRQNRHDGSGLVKTFLLMHLFTLYSTLWFLAGWRATWKTLRGEMGWSKTERIEEHAVQDAAEDPVDHHAKA